MYIIWLFSTYNPTMASLTCHTSQCASYDLPKSIISSNNQLEFEFESNYVIENSFLQCNDLMIWCWGVEIRIVDYLENMASQKCTRDAWCNIKGARFVCMLKVNYLYAEVRFIMEENKYFTPIFDVTINQYNDS